MVKSSVIKRFFFDKAKNQYNIIMTITITPEQAAQYETALNKAVSDLVDDYLSHGGGWKPSTHKEGGQLFLTDVDGENKVVIDKSNKPASAAVAKFADFDHPRKYDGYYGGSTTLATFKLPKSGETAVLRMIQYKGTMIVSDREFLNVYITREVEKGGKKLHVVALVSVTHPDKPEQSKPVRGTMGSSGIVVEDLSATSCKLVNTSRCNFNGWLPGSFLTWAAGEALDTMLKFKAEVEH